MCSVINIFETFFLFHICTISFYSHKNITLKPQKKLTRFLVILKYNKYILFK